MSYTGFDHIDIIFTRNNLFIHIPTGFLTVFRFLDNDVDTHNWDTYSAHVNALSFETWEVCVRGGNHKSMC